MIDNLESKITFEIPNTLDFDRLIRGNNYSSFWQNLHYQQELAARAAGMGSLGLPGGATSLIDYNTTASTMTATVAAAAGSDFNLLNSLQTFASRSGSGVGGGSGGVLGVDGTEQLLDPTYERFIGDVWVGIVLTLMILSSIFCMCSCFLYHKFRQWQRSVLTARSQTLSSMDVETPPPYDVESLPSYTIVSGLPSYNDAIEQLKQKQQQQQQQQRSHGGYEPVKVHHVATHASVIKLFESQSQDLGGQPAKLEEIRYNFVSGPARTNANNQIEVEVSPTTSSQLENAATTTTTAVVPSFKSHLLPAVVEVGDGTAAIAVSLKKFHVSRYTLEDELSHGVSS